MDASNTEKTPALGKAVGGPTVAAAILMWLSQPPLAIWPLGMIGIVPWLIVACIPRRFGRRDYFVIWLAGFLYWAITLQGLRHAHPVIYACWIALAAYLAVYFPVFIAVVRQMLSRGIALWLAAPCVWVGIECIRNYLLSGVSAAMLGHTLAGVTPMIQIADLFGSYGVSFVIVSVSVAMFQLLAILQKQRQSADTGTLVDDETWAATIQSNRSLRSLVISCSIAAALLVSTLAYGYVRLGEPSVQPLATFALIQRNELVEYMQDQSRDVEIFDQYTRQTIASVSTAKQDIDAVVWPESMFSGGLPWMIADDNVKPPPLAQMTADEFKDAVGQNQDFFVRRARQIQEVLGQTRSTNEAPDMIVGCGVIRYRQTPEAYSGVVHVKRPATVGDPIDWYGKTHLVMFGEYVPLVSYIPGLREYIKSIGLGLQTGPGPKRFVVDGTVVAPNLCIETAVERVTINHLASLRSGGEMPDVVVTVTNDGWFDDSSVIDHHLRCGQLVAVGCRRPLLSAANNGPTAWIDSCGRIVERLPTGTNGAIIATPQRDDRISLYLKISDWPARILGLIAIAFLIDAIRQRRQEVKLAQAAPA